MKNLREVAQGDIYNTVLAQAQNPSAQSPVSENCQEQSLREIYWQQDMQSHLSSGLSSQAVAASGQWTSQTDGCTRYASYWSVLLPGTWLILFLHLLFFSFFFILANVGLNYVLNKRFVKTKPSTPQQFRTPVERAPNISWKSLFCCEKRGNTTWRHQLASVVYPWPSVLLCVLQSNNHLSNAVMHRNSRYVLRLKSYQLWHAETTWGNISC